MDIKVKVLNNPLIHYVKHENDPVNYNSLSEQSAACLDSVI